MERWRLLRRTRRCALLEEGSNGVVRSTQNEGGADAPPSSAEFPDSYCCCMSVVAIAWLRTSSRKATSLSASVRKVWRVA